MTDPIHDIVKRLAILEGRITPTEPVGSQNPQQKSVHQLPALFKPGKGGPILGGNPNKPAVTKGYFVGAESEERDEEALEEAQANEEKLLDKVKKSFIDYLDSVEDTVAKKKDRDIGDKPAARDIGKKAKDRDLMSDANELEEEQLDEFLPALGAIAGRALVGAEAGALTRGLAGAAGHAVGSAAQDALAGDEVNEDPTQTEPAADTPAAQIQEPTYAAQPSAPIKTITLEDGRICEIHGDEHTGFEIRHGNRKLPSRFKNLDHATMAMEMYQARCKTQDLSADYVDEA
jgi:hypothetical protein